MTTRQPYDRRTSFYHTKHCREQSQFIKVEFQRKKIIAQFIATIRLEFQASPNVKPSNDNKARSVKLPRIQVVCFVTRTMSSLKQETPRARMIESVTGKFVFKCGKASFVDKLIKQIVILFITNQSQFAFPINRGLTHLFLAIIRVISRQFDYKRQNRKLYAGRASRHFLVSSRLSLVNYLTA